MVEDPFEHVAFLSRSQTRVQLLTYLGDNGTTTRRGLRDALDTSQSTVVRSVQALADRGWVETDNGTVRVTGTGKLVAAAFGDLLAAIDETTHLGPFLRWFPHDEFDLDLTQLRDATVTTSTTGDPYAPGRKQTEVVREATEFRTFLPSIELEGSKVIHDRVVAGDLTAELVVGPDVAETIQQGEYADLFEEQLRTDRLSLSAVDEPLPFYLGLDGEGLVQVGVEDDEGMPRSLLEIEREPVRAWAEGVYGEYRDLATELTVEDF